MANCTDPIQNIAMNSADICDWICEKGSSTHIQLYKLGRS